MIAALVVRVLMVRLGWEKRYLTCLLPKLDCVPIDQLFRAAFRFVIVVAMDFDAIPNVAIVANDVGVIPVRHGGPIFGFADRAT
jgi:hypothetical protein